MSYLPEEWVVSNLKDLYSYDDLATPVEGKLWLTAQLAVNPSPGEEGYYRLVVLGTTQLEVKVEANTVIPDEALCGFWLYGQFEASKIVRFANNTCVTAWMDLRELVASQDLDVYDPEGNAATETFLEALDTARKTSPSLGAAWRWAITVDPVSKVQVSLTSL